jgi:hypothetical protein
VVEIEPLNVVPAGKVYLSWEVWAERVKVGIAVEEAERLVIAKTNSKIDAMQIEFLNFCIAYTLMKILLIFSPKSLIENSS